MGQLRLNIYRGTRGGRRPGAGRKRKYSPGVAYRPREKVTRHQALHVHFKLRASIRNKTCLKILKRAILNARNQGLRVLHFSIESNHIHLILEAQNNETLTRGMRSFRETKNAIYYVLFNHQKHRSLKKADINPYSSLGLIQDLKNLAKEAKLTIVWRKLEEALIMDNPQSWSAKRVLH